MAGSKRTPITDQALPSSTSGQVLVSQGPTAAPIATDTFSTAKTFAAPVTHEAQRQVTGWTSGTNFPSGAFHSIVVGDGYNPDIHWAVSTQAQSDYPADPRPDVISYWGHNVSGNGNPVDPAHPCWGIGLESYWKQLSPTVGQFEGHLQFVSTGGTQLRAWSWAMLQDGSGSYANMCYDQLSVYDHSNTQQMLWEWPTIHVLHANAFQHDSNNVAWLKQVDTTSTPVSLIYLDTSNHVVLGQSGYPVTVASSLEAPVSGSLNLATAGMPVYVGASAPGSAGATLEVKARDATSAIFAGYTSGDVLAWQFTNGSGANGAVGNLYLYGPTGQSAGSAVNFSSNGGTYTAFIQLDGSANMVFRNASASGTTYFDYRDGVAFRALGGAGQTITINSVGQFIVGANGSAQTQTLIGSATLDFPSTASGATSDLTIAVTGAAVGDRVTLGPPASVAAGTGYFAWVSASGVVTVRYWNNSGVAVDPASASFSVEVSR